jgi:hypothetical protein
MRHSSRGECHLHDELPNIVAKRVLNELHSLLLSVAAGTVKESMRYQRV